MQGADEAPLSLKSSRAVLLPADQITKPCEIIYIVAVEVNSSEALVILSMTTQTSRGGHYFDYYKRVCPE